MDTARCIRYHIPWTDFPSSMSRQEKAATVPKMAGGVTLEPSSRRELSENVSFNLGILFVVRYLQQQSSFLQSVQRVIFLYVTYATYRCVPLPVYVVAVRICVSQQVDGGVDRLVNPFGSTDVLTDH
ncbi:unnamed protein product [Ectocarpus sp. 8 AP-2014]